MNTGEAHVQHFINTPTIGGLSPEIAVSLLTSPEITFTHPTTIPLIKDFGNSKKLPYRAVFGQI